MNPVLLDLGIIKIYWYSIMIFLGILFGCVLILREAKKWNYQEDFMINLFFYTIIGAVIGARLYFVAFNWSYYSKNIIDIFKIWEGGLAIHGGILFGMICLAIYCKKYKVKVIQFFDFAVVGVILGQAIGRWGNFFNGEAHGLATTKQALQNLFIPNFIVEGMNIGGIYYHPTFLYESLWCLLGFVLLIIFRKREHTKLGQLTSIYFMWYGVGRFFIEFLRTDSLMFGDFRAAQIASGLLFVIGLLMFIVKSKGSKFDNNYHDDSNIGKVTF